MEAAQEILEAGEGLHHEALSTINSLAKITRKQRLKDGAIAFEKSEVKFKLDDQRKPVDVWFKVQKDAHKLIEEFMLLANKAVAMKATGYSNSALTTSSLPTCLATHCSHRASAPAV